MGIIQGNALTPSTPLKPAPSSRGAAEAAFASFLGKWDMPVGPRVGKVWSQDDTLTLFFLTDGGRNTSERFKYIDPSTRFDPNRKDVFAFDLDRKKLDAFDMELQKNGHPKFTRITLERTGEHKTGPVDRRVAFVCTLHRDGDKAIFEKRYQSIPPTFKFTGGVQDIVNIKAMLSEQPDHRYTFISQT